MSGKTVSGVITPSLYEVVQQAAAYEGASVSATVSAALTLYLGLSGAARRSARHVLAAGTPSARDALLEGCGRAIARAGDQMLREQLAARGRAMGLWDVAVSEEQIDQDAVAAVRDARQVTRAVTAEETAPAR